MTLVEHLRDQPFQGYAYSYPHKTAYRPFSPPLPLDALWAAEKKDALFLYVHLPFCEMRCGFCNLFTTTNPGEGMVAAYLAALDRQMEMMGGLLGPSRFLRAAVGGGTPTFLEEREIAALFASIEKHLGGLSSGVPVSFEMSPGTVTQSKMELLASLGVTRASIGVQSFVPGEAGALGRPQQPETVIHALEWMRASGFAVLNIDLIYGAQNQTPASWEYSLREAMRFEPEEIYLYPLYIRPLTGLGRHGREPSDNRLELYQRGRDFLLARDYEQISMRLFRRRGPNTAGPVEGPVYCCQEDGMVGLGAGARSYTKAVHYSTEYAVGREGIREIIDGFVATHSGAPDGSWAVADYGCVLDEVEQRRRYIIKSLLRAPGLDLAAYAGRFGETPLADFPELDALLEHGLAMLSAGIFALTPAGIERSDTIGPWLFSAETTARMGEYVPT